MGRDLWKDRLFLGNLPISNVPDQKLLLEHDICRQYAHSKAAPNVLPVLHYVSIRAEFVHGLSRGCSAWTA